MHTTYVNIVRKYSMHIYCNITESNRLTKLNKTKNGVIRSRFNNGLTYTEIINRTRNIYEESSVRICEYEIFAHARTEGDSTMAKREGTMVTVRQYDGDNTTIRW